ncbi:hypothetical protein DND132_2864 [Pseudodesulfovibrio mercurii]|uniref:Uncharacterized protein n=1 Tax=Pseudodesulfovibrio mercurii TaxID=641491 RepID=F0JD29_9BACT|nr:hypothetical protein [Pseudodesulfovibrio mercurii]EGB14521.1 hypothetical protein DND132_1312 [Pseudodesulfovibrio mercurii]EGB16067.1 hypothetical protein DND132_2864 [Pseudodesulfovibrio mercurii]
MKVEIGESLVRTWVRHCRGCQLAELNWKPSPIWPGEITAEHEQWYREGAAEFSGKVLKKTSSLSQFLGQAEIDVLGVQFVQGMARKVIAADIAFHTNGLQYGPKAETAARIVKKLFRTALTIDIHFPGVPAEILFLSPKVNNATIQGVKEAARMMESFFRGRRDGFRFQTIINQGFKNIVLDDVTPLQKQVADTSELYLRAAQLVGLFEDRVPRPAKATAAPAQSAPRKTGQTLPIEYVPGDTKEFKRLLLKQGAVIQEHYADGRTKERQWDASGMRETSSVSGNLRSKSWYKGGAWLTSGISKIVVKIIGYDT